MIEFLSSWVKSLGVAIIIVSILEMLLPNNKTKKYIRMIMGIYILFNIIAPFIQNKDKINLNEISIEDFAGKEIQTTTSTEVNQTSMNKRIEQLYTKEIKADIMKKIEEKGYVVNECKITANIKDEENETKITKLKLKISKSEKSKEEVKKQGTIENKIITEIQKIKVNPIEIEREKKEDTSISKIEIQNLKKFLIEEYGVSEECLEIN